MKKILAALLAVIAICSVSRADQILIYRGIQSDRQNDASVKRYGYYYIFDLTTAEFEGVQFGPLGGLATANNKYFSTGTTSSFIYSPDTEKGARTQTDFLYTSSTTGTPFAVAFGDFKGANVAHNDLGGGFTGQFPNSISLVARAASGDGTLPSDNIQLISGVFSLIPVLTRESNASTDVMSQAVTIVTGALQKAGYRSE